MSKRISCLVMLIEQSIRLYEKYGENEELRRFFEMNIDTLKLVVEQDATEQDLDDLTEIGY